MLIGALVAKLAMIVRESGRGLSPTQRHMVDVLGMLPVFVTLRRADLWEAVFPPSIGADDAGMNRLLEAIYNLGCYNLYTQFDPRGTLRAYGEVAAIMREQGFEPPVVEVMTGW